MNVGDERSSSCWMAELPAIAAPPLRNDAECDVLVVGSGIAGLSTAYELARFGRSVIVIDRGRIAAGMTARTTAHLASALDDYYAQLIKVRGEDEARLYHAISGTPAFGTVGPDLTHVASRASLAAGELPNIRIWLERWIADPQGVKPGSHMPRVPLSAADIRAAAAYLETLR